MSVLPKQVPNQSYGFFGYKGAMCDRAISQDRADMLKECVELDFIDPTSEMLNGRTVLEYCRKVAPNCAAMLEAMVTK